MIGILISIIALETSANGPLNRATGNDDILESDRYFILTEFGFRPNIEKT